MPRITNTIIDRKKKLFERLTPDYIQDHTAIFKFGDPQTIEYCKKMYEIYYDTWIKEEAELFLLNQVRK